MSAQRTPGPLATLQEALSLMADRTAEDREARTLVQAAIEQLRPLAWADAVAFESAMKAGKGCDVWPTAGDYEQRTGRKLVALAVIPKATRGAS